MLPFNGLWWPISSRYPVLVSALYRAFRNQPQLLAALWPGRGGKATVNTAEVVHLGTNEILVTEHVEAIVYV